MATVFRCHDPNLDRYVAVKVLPSYYTEDPTFTARFTQEAQTVARLSHPNILQIFDFGEDKGFTYIVSELISGGDLQDRLGSAAMSVEEVLGYMAPLSEALDYAHGQGIIHRDLKPANILIDVPAGDRPVLADFGLARMLESTTRFTQASQAIGTPEYMAPEQAMGADADHRSDLYAFGIMIYQMLLGQTPFRADTPAATLMAHVHRPLPLPTSIIPDISPRLEATLLKALAKEPDDRFQSAKEMTDSLQMSPGGARAGAADDDEGATAVLDTEAPTALMDADAAEAPAPADAAARPPAAAPAAPAKAAEGVAPEPTGIPRWVMGAAAAVVVVLVVGVGAVFALSGDGEVVPETSVVTDGGGESKLVETIEAAPEESIAVRLDKLNKLISDAKETIARVRDVVVVEGLGREFKDTDDLDLITRGFFKREDIRQDVFEAGELYKSLGLMDEREDLEDILLGIQLQQVTAVYDDRAEKVYVVSDSPTIGPVEELGIAVAFMQTTQQELFDVFELRKRAREGGSDQLRAVDALIKGDVSQVMAAYFSTFSKDEAEILAKPLADNKLAQAPEVVQAANRFSRREGHDLVNTLFDRDGWVGVNQAYKRPPVSTEQVIHPEKYFAGEEPEVTTLPNFADKLGKGWQQMSSNTMGEFLLRTYLEQHLDTSQAADAAAGWGGDRYSLLNGPEAERLLLATVKWDTPEDSKQFYDAYQVFVGIKTRGAGTSVPVGETGRKWIMPNETIFVGQLGDKILLIIGDEEEDVGKGLQLLAAWLLE